MKEDRPSAKVKRSSNLTKWGHEPAIVLPLYHTGRRKSRGNFELTKKEKECIKKEYKRHMENKEVCENEEEKAFIDGTIHAIICLAELMD